MANIKTFKSNDFNTKAVFKNFYDFLIANKEGTFLENTVIMLEEYYTKLTINSDEEASLSFYWNSSSTSSSVIFCENENIIMSLAYGNVTSISTPTVALLCNNGLLITVGLRSGDATTPAIMLTVDSNNDLAVGFKNVTTLYNTMTEYGIKTMCKDSASVNGNDLTTAFNSPYTSLTPIVPQSNSSATLPYAYIAPYTQLGSSDLTVVSIEGEVYITTGVWYIKATD